MHSHICIKKQTSNTRCFPAACWPRANVSSTNWKRQGGDPRNGVYGSYLNALCTCARPEVCGKYTPALGQRDIPLQLGSCTCWLLAFHREYVSAYALFCLVLHFNKTYYTIYAFLVVCPGAFILQWFRVGERTEETPKWICPGPLMDLVITYSMVTLLARLFWWAHNYFTHSVEHCI